MPEVANPLVDARSRFAKELEDPEVRRLLMASAHAEVGEQGPAAQQAYIETVMNRAAARGRSLAATITDSHYYPEETISKLGHSPSQAEAEHYNGLINSAVEGSNVSNYATGNASGSAGFGGGPETFESGGERFGIEKGDGGWVGRAGGIAPPSKSSWVKRAPPSGSTRIGTTLEKPPAPPAPQQPAAEPAAEEQPTTPAPAGAVNAAPISQDQIASTESDVANNPEFQAELAKVKSDEKKKAKLYEAQQNAVMGQHSQALEPNDLRVAERINPDTGSQRTVGQYFVPGDPLHERLLRGQTPEDLAKLPIISQAIARGEPFHSIYTSAEPEYSEEPPTQESRQFEYQKSTAQQRIAAAQQGTPEGEEPPPSIDQHLSMIPIQLAATKDRPDQPPDIMMEGFAHQSMLNNGGHLWRGARQAGIKVPYSGPEDPQLQRDVMGYMHNQKNGFRGDGSQMLDENGQPHPLWKENQAKAMPYVPHMLDRGRAEFIHAMTNIRPGAKPKPPTSPPGFGERAAWQRRVNEGYHGQLAGTNRLLEELDRKLPEVRPRRWKWNGKTREFEVHHGNPVPWSKGTLESTWRKYHVKLMKHLGMPPIGSESIRETGMPAHVLVPHAPAFKQVAAQYEPHQPAPISENPEVGSPLGPGEKLKSAAVHYHQSGKIYEAPYHKMAETMAARAGEPQMNFANAERGFTTTHGRFFTHGELYKPTPIGENPEVGSYTDRPGEKITHAAVRYGEKPGRIFLGANHEEAHRKAINKGHNPEFDDYTDGFFTNQSRFLDRNEAYHAALRAKQMYKNPVGHPGSLMAEDVNYRARNLPTAPIGPKQADLFNPAPVSGNPEVGAPAGGANPEGAPGLLSGEAQEQETQAPRGGMGFVSPSIRENMSYNAAKLALSKPPQQKFLDFSDRMERQLSNGYKERPASVTSGVGHWRDGAENSSIAEGYENPEQGKLGTAIKSLYSGQRQGLYFHPDEKGPHTHYQLTFNSDDPDEVGTLLDKHGITYRTFEPRVKGKPIKAHVIDTEQALPHEMVKLLKSGHIREPYYRRGHAEFIGDPNAEDREKAAADYRGIIRDAGESWLQKNAEQRGTRAEPSPAQPPWQASVDEAEQAFRELRDSDLYKKQQLALDYKRSALDRADLPIDQARARDEYHTMMKNWVGLNPELNKSSMFSYLLGHSQFPGKLTKRGIAEHFEATHPRLDYSKEGDRELAADMLFRDSAHAMAGSHTGQPSEAYGWYDRSVNKTIDHYAMVDPKIKEDPQHNLAYRLALAITSQGQEVPDNAESAWNVYKYWEDHNHNFPEDNKFIGAGGKEIAQITQNLKKVNGLWDKHGPEELERILRTPIVHSKLQSEYGLKASGEAQGTTLKGAMGLGPKIGAFFLNLSGDYSPITMDRWFARNLNMYAGNMFNFSENAMKKGTADYGPQLEDVAKLLDTPEAMAAAGSRDIAQIRKELKALHKVKEGELSRAKALELAPTLYDWAKRATQNYARSYGPSQRSWHPDFATPEHTLAKRIHENADELADAPRNATEREHFRDIIRRTHEKLKGVGINLTNADKQAVPWFPIKDVFRMGGSSVKQNVDYLDAAHTMVRRIKEGYKPLFQRIAEANA